MLFRKIFERFFIWYDSSDDLYKVFYAVQRVVWKNGKLKQEFSITDMDKINESTSIRQNRKAERVLVVRDSKKRRSWILLK